MNSSSLLKFKLPTKTDQPENFIKFIYYKPCITRNCKYVKLKLLEPFLELSDQICDSPYCQPYNSYKVSSENLVLDQLTSPKLIIFFILITHLVDIVLIL